jgi:glutamine---fructose-6-phosphate transaminase (isomerizing)
MYKTEVEIFGQYDALKKTYEYLMGNAEKILKLWGKEKFKSMTFTGSGSSYSLCKSARISAWLVLGVQANAIAAGDLMLNFPQYKNALKDTLLVAPSRSGSTSEVLMAAEKVKEDALSSCISICARKDSQLSHIADLDLAMPWVFDESVCQTRTVTNLYTANLMLIGIMAGDLALLEEIKNAIEEGNEFINSNRGIFKELANEGSWNRVVVLADSELEGIAEEGALAFNEICRLHSNYYHLLDVRHGPMVLIDNRTLVIAAVSPYGAQYQKDLIRDLRSRGAKVLAVGTDSAITLGADYNITVPENKHISVAGIPFIFVPQALSFFRAVASGVNPDEPQGLDPWIKL